MDKKLIGIIITCVLLAGVAAVVFLNKPQPNQEEKKQESMIKKVDLASQPEWVQKLEVTAVKGVNPTNKLGTVTFTVKGIAKDVTSVDYVMQYETTTGKLEGAFSTKSQELKGATEFKKSIDLGSCSAGGKCIVNTLSKPSIDLELDFTTTDSSKFSFVKTISL